MARTKETSLSPSELEELQAYKEQREKQDREKIGITDELVDYEVPKGEENDAHLLVGFISRVNLQDRSKDELGRKFVHKLSQPAYLNFLENIANLGYKIIKVLHIPKGWQGPSDYFAAKEKAHMDAIAKAKKTPKNQSAALVME